MRDIGPYAKEERERDKPFLEYNRYQIYKSNNYQKLENFEILHEKVPKYASIEFQDSNQLLLHEQLDKFDEYRRLYYMRNLWMGDLNKLKQTYYSFN